MKSVRSVVLPSYNRNVLRALLSLSVQETSLAAPSDGEVLVRVHAAPVNPSDIAFVQGGYNIIKTLPAVPGFEGSGIVEEAGGDMTRWLGKPVSFFVQEDRPGSWASHVLVKEADLISLPPEMDMDQAACLAINPMTAVGLFGKVNEQKSGAVIVNAAGGQVPAFIRTLAAEQGIPVINIVRKEPTAERLISEGQAYVLVEGEGLEERLKELAHRLDARVAFDAVGGPVSGQIVNAMPDGGSLWVYGGLSNKAVSEVGVMEVIFHGKSIQGFNLVPWKDRLSAEKRNEIITLVCERIASGQWTTTLGSQWPLEKVVEGLKHYLGHMSEGKVLFKP